MSQAPLSIPLIAHFVYSTRMPAETCRGSLPPLTAEQDGIRARLAEHVQMLAGSIGERNLWRYPALMAAADYIEATLVQFGYRPGDELFDSRGKPVRNIVAEKPGRSAAEEIILVGAHYDSVMGSPGANDNGSGVAALLELACLLANRESRRTVRFVAFVNEEPPFSFSGEMGSLVNARAASSIPSP